jgi:hypothetical protein
MLLQVDGSDLSVGLLHRAKSRGEVVAASKRPRPSSQWAHHVSSSAVEGVGADVDQVPERGCQPSRFLTRTSHLLSVLFSECRDAAHKSFPFCCVA